MVREIFIILLLTTSILTITASNTNAHPLTNYSINSKPVDEELVDYARYAKDVFYAYVLQDTPAVSLTIIHDDYLLANYEIAADVNQEIGKAEVSIDSDGYGVLIAYRTGDDMVKAKYVEISTGDVLATLTLTSPVDGVSGLPIVKYAKIGSDDLWFISYTVKIGEVDVNTVLDIYRVSPGPTFTLLHRANIKLDAIGYRRKAFFDPNTNSFYITGYRESILGYGLKVVGVNALTGALSVIGLVIDSNQIGSQYYMKLFKRYYAESLEDGGKILVVHGYSYGSTVLKGYVVDLSTSTVTSIDLDPGMGDYDIRPWISSSSSEWLVTWSYTGSIYGLFVNPYPTVSVSPIYRLGYVGAHRYFREVVSAYNGLDYTVAYSVRSNGDFNIYGLRIRTDGTMTLSIHALHIATEPGVDERTLYMMSNSDNPNYQSIFYFRYGGTVDSHVAVFHSSEIHGFSPVITVPPIDPPIIVFDGTIRSSGEVIYSINSSGVSYLPVHGYLYRQILYDSFSGDSLSILVDEAYGKTNESGCFELVFNPGSGVEPGIYYVDLEFPEDYNVTPRQASLGPYIILDKSPGSPQWPVDYLPGPTYMVKNGAVVITDPWNEVLSNNRLGLDISDVLGNGSMDLDVSTLMMSIDEQYLYVRALFNESINILDGVAPVLMIAFDFTPDKLCDGVGCNETNNFKTLHTLGSTDTYLWRGEGWDWIIVATPYDPWGYVASSTDNTYSLTMLIRYGKENYPQYRELGAGYFTYRDNELIIYAPLSIVEHLNTGLKTHGNVSWRMFSAIYGLDTASKRIVDVPGANWLDTPGAITVNTTPTHLSMNNIYESPLDDPLYPGPSYELDNYFNVNIDMDNREFYSYAEIVFCNLTVNTGDSDIVDERLNAYIGVDNYLVRIIDANNTGYGLVGKEVKLYIENTLASSGTSDLGGYVNIEYDWKPVMYGKQLSLFFAFKDSGDYVEYASPSIVVVPKYIVRVVDGYVELIDRDGKPVASPGDTIRVVLYVEAWVNEWRQAPSGLRFTVYLNSTSYYLGEAVTSSDGTAVLNYIITGDEGLFDLAPTSHEIAVYGDPSTTYMGGYIVLDFPYSLGMTPLPEPMFLPILLITALALFLFWRKKECF